MKLKLDVTIAAARSVILANALVFSILCVNLASCTHFRGATLSWKPVNPSSTTDKRVVISLRIAWRRSYDRNTNCDQSTINSGRLIGPSGSNLQCRSGCSGYVGSMNYKCTDFSVQEDWSAGGRDFTCTFPNIHPPLYQASFSGRDWIPLVYGGGSWEVRMYVNLTKRKDTGLINTSPTAAMSPIVRLQYGCNHTIVIPVSDADKDDIRCRWADTRKSECGDACWSFLGAWLYPRTCEIKYLANRYTGWYAATVMIEDFADRLSSNALSSIPIQFLVQVFTSSAQCASKPDFSRETRVAGSCIGVPHGWTLNERIIAKSHGAGNRIIEIKTISPSGLTKSSLAQYSANEWYVSVTWTPSRSQVDPVIFCYTAIDANGLSSVQTCVTLLTGVAPPYMVNGSHFPTGLIYPNNQRWIVNFDKEFVRPTRSRYIRIFRSDGTAVYTVDVSISHDVIYPAGSLLGRTLEFRPSLRLIEKSTYYVLLDPGIVQGTKFCGPESPPMRDPYFWRFTIRDVTAPVVTFTSAPSVTSNATTITWRIDEPATSLCIVTGPTKTSVFVCNESWVGSGLAEGYYRISITATDAAGNIARPVFHSWNVDLTPPEPYLTTKPRTVSRETSSTFRFSCRRDNRCYYECSVAQYGANPKYSRCYGSGFIARNLVNDVVYVFRLKARDSVGNQAQVLTYKWRVDTRMPTISNVKTLSVICTSDLNPLVIGKPSVTDNEDPNPRMVYRDLAAPSGCGVQRMWTATDRAGNIATASQTIHIQRSLAPIFNYDDSIVVACQTLLTMENEIKKTINVTHPCGIPTSISHNDSKSVMQCGSSLVRTWTARDSCGHFTTVVQTIRILALQLPDYPKSGQVNVDLNQQLNWPQYPGADRYKVYMWKSTATKPTTPTAVTTSRVFSPSSGQLPHGTQMLWQIEYIISSGHIIPSPIWGFVTRHFPDFQIDSISLPPNAFSGQTVSVSWTVRNVGGIGNTAFRWLDRIYIGRTTSFSQSRRMSTVSQERFLFPNDAYVGSATLQLRDDDIGVFYVFVVTDTSRQIQDIDRTNNIKVSWNSLTVALTPPPNLKVESIVLPSTTYSGNSITVKWTVANRGVGITGNAQWLDRLFLSRNNILDNDDNYLGSKVHNGFLSVRQTYTETKSVKIPHAIFGDFHIIIVTDSTNTVFENTGENDNIRASTSTVKVILTPPPDLIVSSLDVPSATFVSGTTVNIDYIITNMGLGAPFHNWWNDQVSIMNLETRRKYIIATPSYSGIFPAGKSYSRKVSFVVSPNLKTGKYGLSVVTDINNRVFEFTYENNNLKEMNVTIVQRLPDLFVSQVQGFIISDPITTSLQINYTIENRGRGMTYGAPWVDRVFLTTTTSFSLNTAISLGYASRQANVPPRGSYNVINAKFNVKREVFGTRYVFVVADAYSEVLEEEESNNNRHSQAIAIPRMFPDLAVQMLDVLSGSYIYAGTSMKVAWRVKNDGPGSTLDNSWRDMLYLSKTTSLSLGAVKIYEGSVRPRTLPAHFYNFTAMVRTPDNLYGEYFLIIKVNGDNTLAETDFSTNNVAHTRITLTRMPQPNLQIVIVTYQYEALGNFLDVQWKAKNFGYSMTKTNTWTDRVVLSPSSSTVTGSSVHFLGSRDVTAKLSSQQEYGASTTVSIPKSISGPMYVHVIINYEGKLQESSRDQDNTGHDATPALIKEPPLPILDVEIQTRLYTNLTCDEPFPFIFKVQNRGEGDASFDSWTDAVFVYYKSDSSLQEIIDYGRRLLLRIHMGGLLVNDSYTVNTTISISCMRLSNVYLYAFSDINNRVGWKSSPKDTSKIIHLLSGPSPDLQGAFVNSSLQSQGGSPLKVHFEISTNGDGSKKGSWFNALYLSQDVLKDPFDLKLASLSTNVVLKGNTSVLLDVVVFIPYDTIGSDYYLLLEVDSGNLVYESNEDNNMAYVLMKIQPTARTDILVASVSTAPMTLSLHSVVKVDWTLRNNGTQLAKGYKCDSVYLSQDEVWQIEDTEVAQPKCEFTSLLPYNNGHNRDTAFSLQNSLPLVAQGQYRGLVKSRSNIRDPFPNNNIKAGPRNINVTFPLLSLGSCVEANDGTSVFIINNVPPEMTLIVTARVNVVTSFQDLYLRHNKPASSYHYDGNSKFAMSSKQDALVTSTKKGSYYVMLQRNDITPAPGVKSRVCAKLAKFEILNIFPTAVAPLGIGTLRVEGTLFGWKLEVFLISKEQGIAIKAKRVYRFSSTLLYATFNMHRLAGGKTFHCKITDTAKDANAVLNDSVTVTDGTRGKLTVTMNKPQAIRLLDTADITVSYQNIGDTDIPSPIVMFSANGRSLLRYVQDGRQPSTYEKSLLVVAQPLEGPGGILPPKSSGRLRFQAKHLPGSGTGRSKLSVRSLLDNNEPHLFMQSKDKLKPSHLSDDLWNPVWKNFLSSIGTTQRSFNRRLSSVATRMSLDGRRVHMVDELVKFQLDFANGVQSGSKLLHAMDVTDQYSSNLLTLRVERIYSPLLTRRRGRGIFGVGWIAPWWETSIRFMNDTVISILYMRDEIKFWFVKPGYFEAVGRHLTIEIKGNDLILNGVASDESEQLVFDLDTKSLKEIRRVHVNDTITVTAYTADSKPRQLEHSAGGSITLDFNSRGLVRKVVLIKSNREQSVSFYDYDQDAPILTSITSNEETTRYSYTSNQDLESVTYPNGATLRYAYTPGKGFLGKIVGLTPKGQTSKAVEFQHDLDGLVKVINLVDDSSTTFAFDESMKVLSITGNDGVPFRTRTKVSGSIAIKSLIHGDQIVEQETSNTDKKTRTVKVEDANGDKVKYLVGNDGIPQSITDAAGNVFSFNYDNATNRLSESRFPDGTRESFGYDARGNLNKRTTRNGKDVVFENGADGKMVKKSVPDVGPTYYLHDSRGNIIMATNKEGTVTLRYNRDNNPTSVTYPDGRHLEYRYNKIGQRIGLSENSTGYNVTYHYDDYNRLSEVYTTTGPEGKQKLLKLEYDSDGKLIKKILGNNGSSEYTYVPGMKRLKKLANVSPFGNISSSFEYDYDDKGRAIKIASKDGIRLFTYDAASQLVGWTDVMKNGARYSHTYEYDSRGNRVFSTDDDYRDNYETNIVNQYMSVGDNEFVYDRNGNMISKKNRNVRAKDVKYVFSEENVLLQTETVNERCDYVYDSLGNLYKKKCTSGDTRYLIDPFGIFGSNIIAQISGGSQISLFVHTDNEGLLAHLDGNGTAAYYEFNGEGNVVGLVDHQGNALNSYRYGPFGTILYSRESVTNDFLFVGQWGVMREKGIPYLYRMRSRHYDAEIGRFLSYDPLGYRTLSTNLYQYAYNNPISLQDPRGRLPVLLVGALVGAAAGVGSYLVGQWITGDDITLGGAVNAGFTGAVTGTLLTGAAVAGLSAGATALLVAPYAFSTNALGYMMKQGIDNKPINKNEMLLDAAIGTVTTFIPIKAPLTKFLKKFEVKKFLDGLYGGSITNSVVNYLKKYWEVLKDPKKLQEKMKELYDDFMDWMQSLDPNDILGPTGFGDARFIAEDTLLEYKIRFENDPNATAPAQRVVINYKLDKDLDPRTFRIGSFSFGNFTKEQSPSPFLQEKLDLSDDRNLLVRVTAGIDVVQNEATWDLQSLDPKTGEAPRDPRRGFLPPNNGTTGQGYVTFSVRVKSGVKPLTRIDATASIIFDRNEAIDTPPIFNTIDNSKPKANLTVLQDLLKKGSLAVVLAKEDIGTGVQSVDIYYQEVQDGLRENNVSSFQQLLDDITDDTAILPLSPGKSYKLVTSSVDHVGNKQDMEYGQSIFVDFPEIQSSCAHLNNCSGHGNCSMFSLCVCEEGYYGVNCSQDEPPLEPPVLEASSSGGIEDTPIPVFLSASMIGINRTDGVTLSITIYGVPDLFVFSRGMRSKDQVALLKQQFGDLFMTPPKDFSGNLTVKIVAQAARGPEQTQTKTSLNITVKAKADTPTLITEDACVNLTGLIPLSIKAGLNDNDGSEKLTIALSGLPNDYELNHQGRLVNGTHYLDIDSLTGLVAQYEEAFEPFVLKVVATSVETPNEDSASIIKVINVESCILQFTCEKNCSGHGVCVAPNECRCEEGYKGPDCSEDSTVNINPGDTKHLAAIVGGSLGGLIFLLLIIAFIVLVILKARKTAHEKTVKTRNVYNNPAYESTC